MTQACLSYSALFSGLCLWLCQPTIVLGASSAPSLPRLAKALCSPLLKTRLKALRLVQSLQTKGQVLEQAVARRLRATDGKERARSAQTLCALRYKQSDTQAQLLTLALSDVRRDVREQAARTLANARTAQRRKALSSFSQALRSSDALKRSAAVTALGIFQTSQPQIHQRLRQALRDSSPFVRRAAAWSLRRLQPYTTTTVQRRHVQALAAQIQREPLFALRLAQLSSLEAFGQLNREIRTFLLQRLKSKKRFERIALLRLLVFLGPDALPARSTLLQWLSLGSSYVRMGAARVLAQMGADAHNAIPLLKDQLTHPSFRLRLTALEALLRLKDNPAHRSLGLQVVRAALNKYNSADMAVRLVGRRPAPFRSLNAELHKAVMKGVWLKYRIHAAIALYRIAPRTKPTTLLAPLHKGLHDHRKRLVHTHTRSIRRLAAKTLASWTLSDASTLKSLRLALRDEDHRVRRFALEALVGRLGHRAVPLLRKASKDPGRIVRAYARQQLVRFTTTKPTTRQSTHPSSRPTTRKRLTP